MYYNYARFSTRNLDNIMELCACFIEQPFFFFRKEQRNIIPGSTADGIKSRIENMDIFAVSFAADPMILAIIKTFALINTPLSQSQATR